MKPQGACCLSFHQKHPEQACTCKCHQSTGAVEQMGGAGTTVTPIEENPLEWEKEINKYLEANVADEKFNIPWLKAHLNKIIPALLSSERERCAGVVEGMKVDEDFNSSWHRENAHGYNEALTDAADKIRKSI